MKKPAFTITLFSEHADTGPRPTTIAASAVLHVVAIGVILFGIVYRPPVARLSTDHYRVRELDLDMPDEARVAPPRIPYPAASPGAHAKPSEGKPAQSVPALNDVAKAPAGPQTLIQPDVLKPITLPMPIPVPQVAIWAPSKVIVKKVAPPLPQKPTAADVQPSVESPNEELTLSDVNVASSFHPTSKPIITPSTTSPIAVHNQKQVQMPPVTFSKSITQPTPASILSLSNLRMKEGVATLPPVNEAVVVKAPGVLGAQGKDASAGNPSSSAKPGQGGTSPGPGGNLHNQSSGPGQGLAFKIAGPGVASPNGSQEAPESASGNGTDRLENAQSSTTNVSLPKEGHFSVFVVGNSIQDQYPEIAGVWNGRMAYTVYLKVGLTHSWVMQYSLPRNAEAPQTGAPATLEAPWPYNIVRPNLDPGSIDADALMIHGYVNQSGHFETLSIVFPQSFPQAQFVLAALEKWQFRPAMQQGQSAKVEVLLIIPEQFE
ncbi:MAG TPA: hypothetical protein VGG45_18455 [Terracidiphilus sp.]